MNKQSCINEKDLKGFSNLNNLEAMKIKIRQMEKSVCKIECQDYHGTGFFCQIQNNKEWNSILRVLMTNNHILERKDIKPGKKIKFSINNGNSEFEILIDESRKVYTNEYYDVTIIEIKQNDGLKPESFLEIYEQIYDDNPNETFKNRPIYLLHYPKGKEICETDGLLQLIEEDNLTIHHLCDSSPGSSGGPLFNSKNNKVIGIHKGASTKNWNIGILLMKPIKDFFENYNTPNMDNFNNFFDSKIREEIIKKLEISEELLDPLGDKKNWKKVNEKRGGEIYIRPSDDWIGFGLKVKNKYDNCNNDWLDCKNKNGEFAVAYYGINNNNKFSIDLNNKNNLSNIFADENDIRRKGLMYFFFFRK